ncbi:MAG: aminotransferase class V-fold PLP-dependent enzyme [Bacteroidota bacterium]
MPPVTFYPGPSKVYPEVANYMQDAYNEGVLSINHRSAACMDIVKATLDLLNRKLHVPADYAVFFVSSATESWEIISQSLVREQSFHLYNGAFGKKWLEYAQNLRPLSIGATFDLNTPLAASQVEIPKKTEVVCLTQNETSNGTQVSMEAIAALQSERYLTAVDATSSLGGVLLDFTKADIWLASVQKCLGLPAGLGLLICSPRALQRAWEIKERKHYNSLLFLQDNMQKFQTQYTPNVLNIYLLKRVLEQVAPIVEIADRLQKQASEWYTLFDTDASPFRLLAQNPAVRSDTVITVAAEPALLSRIKSQASQVGILLGNGYGSWKDTTFRIANFPAITPGEISMLKHFLVLNTW